MSVFSQVMKIHFYGGNFEYKIKTKQKGNPSSRKKQSFLGFPMKMSKVLAFPETTKYVRISNFLYSFEIFWFSLDNILVWEQTTEWVFFFLTSHSSDCSIRRGFLLWRKKVNKFDFSQSQLLMINQESHDKVVRLTKKITRQKKKHRNQPRPDGLGMISMLFLLTRYFFVNRTPYHAITSNNSFS